MKKIYLLIMVCAISFAALNAQTVILSENFEAGTTLPTGWTQTTLATDGGWLIGTGTSLSSTYFTIPDHTQFIATNDDGCNCDKSDDFLMTPTLDLSTYTSVFLKFDAFFYSATYSGDTEIATIRYSTDDGVTWTDITTLQGTAWGTLALDVSAAAGSSTAKIGFHYNDGSGWLYGWALDNIEIYEPLSFDAANMDLDMQSYIAVGSADIQGTFANMGATTITSIDVNYSIDGGTPVTYTMTGLTVDPLTMGSYMHNTPANFATAGQYVVVAWLSNPNGSADLNTSNDSITFTVTVLDQVSQRMVLVEHHTQASCGPCASQNPTLDALINEAQNLGKVAHIGYHTSWPGTDPMYDFNVANNEGDARVAYYGVSGVPNCVIAGNQADGLPGVVTQEAIDGEYARAGLFNVSGDASLVNTTLTINLAVEALTNFPDGTLKAHVVLCEEVTYTAAPGSNGETYFPDVMRRMFPTPDGTDIGNPISGGISNLNFTYEVQVPVDMENAHLVVFVQNDADMEVYMATTVEISTIGIEENSAADFAIYPNPTTGVFNITNIANSEITVYNVLGEVVESVHTTDFATTIDLSGQADGTYMIQIRNNDQIFTKKVLLSR